MATLRPKNRLSYWARRVIEDEEMAEKLAEEASGRIRQLYITQYKKTVLQMERLYAQVQDGKTPNRTALWDYSRWREMEKSLSSFVKGGSIIEQERITDCLDKVFEQVIGAPVTDFRGTGFTAAIDPKAVIGTAWSGDNYSNRVWKNRTALADRVRISMEDMVAGNKRLDEVRREIMHEFDAAYYQADRLVRTESSYVFNRTTIERYRQLGVERVEWIAQGSGSCKICAQRDGMIWPINTVPVIPAHPNCNCTYAAYTDADEWLDLGGEEEENRPEDAGKQAVAAEYNRSAKDALNPELIAELEKNRVKFSREGMLFVTRDRTGQIVWLEKGNDSRGFKHILKRHAVDFSNAFGVKTEEIPGYIRHILESAVMISNVLKPINGRDGYERIYEVDGKFFMLHAVGTNGFIVSAYPIDEKEKNRRLRESRKYVN